MSADVLVTEFEAVPALSAWLPHYETAFVAVASERDATDAVVFERDLRPVPADVPPTYAALIARYTALHFGELGASDHARALTTWPELATAFRSQEFLADLASAASAFATPRDHHETQVSAGARAAAAAVAKYKLAIATQLSGAVGPLADAARALLACDALDRRLTAKRAELQAAAAAEIVRLEHEKRAGARAISNETRRKVAEATAAAVAAARTSAQAEIILRKAKADALVAELRASGLKTLRVGTVDEGQLYDVEHLVKNASIMETRMLDRLERALAEVST